MKTSFGTAIMKGRIIILIVTLLLTLVLGYFLKALKVDPDVFNYLPEDDPKASLFKEVGEKYGGNYIGIIGLETDDVFNTRTLEHIRSVTDSVRYTDGVGTVTSLTNVIDIKRSDFGIEIGKLIDEYDLPQTNEELERLKEYTLSDDMYRGTLVSDDATFTAIMVRIKEGTDKIAVAAAIKKKVDSMNLPEKTYFGGMPFAIQSLGEIIMDDMLILAPLTALVIILLLFIGFRSWRGVLLPLLTVFISIIWSIGLMGLLGVRISIISDVIPVILLAVGSAYTIHVLNRIRETDGVDLPARISKALDYIKVPVFLAAITTMAGFISFIFGSYLTLISSFGIFTAAGVGFAMVLSLTFAPALMSYFPEKKKKSQNRGNFLHGPLEYLSAHIILHPKRTILVWCIILVVSISGTFLIQRKVDVIDYFKRSDPTYVAEKIFREKFGGSMPVYVVVRGDIQSPTVLRNMEDLESEMKRSDAIINTQSIADLIEKMNDVMKDGKRIPESKWKIQQLWFLLESQEVMEQLVNFAKTEAVINATFNKGGVEEMKKFTGGFQEYIDGQYPIKDLSEDEIMQDSTKIAVSFSGLPSLYLNIDRSLISSQMQSLIFAILLVIVMVSLMLRSVRLGTYALGPILATLTVLFGFMGLAGIPLDIATVLVGSVSIGIGIDYAIHMVTHINHEIRSGRTMSEAIQHAIRISGKSISINVLAVALGFLVLIFSSLVPLQRFGLLVAVTMVTSGMAAMTLLPAMLILGERKRNKSNNKSL